jgi:actin-related protein 8
LRALIGWFPQSFSVSLSLPDSFSEREAMELVNVLLARLKFRDVLVHRESVLTCLGAGLVNACVVDVGAQKTHVACIQDGVLVPRTR